MPPPHTIPPHCETPYYYYPAPPPPHYAVPPPPPAAQAQQVSALQAQLTEWQEWANHLQGQLELATTERNQARLELEAAEARHETDVRHLQHSASKLTRKLQSCQATLWKHLQREKRACDGSCEYGNGDIAPPATSSPTSSFLAPRWEIPPWQAHIPNEGAAVVASGNVNHTAEIDAVVHDKLKLPMVSCDQDRPRTPPALQNDTPTTTPPSHRPFKKRCFDDMKQQQREETTSPSTTTTTKEKQSLLAACPRTPLHSNASSGSSSHKRRIRRQQERRRRRLAYWSCARSSGNGSNSNSAKTLTPPTMPTFATTTSTTTATPTSSGGGEGAAVPRPPLMPGAVPITPVPGSK